VTLEPIGLVVLVGWGALVGLDLVSFPQAMLSRPLVAGTVAGLVTGDLEAGLRVGVVLELFALEVLPIGASRYPDYGPPTVVAVAIVAGQPWRDTLGAAVLLAVALALLAGRGIDLVRRWNGARVRRSDAVLASGDRRALARLQAIGLAVDAARGALVTALGLGLWVLARGVLGGLTVAGTSLTLVAVGGGLVAAAGGVARRAAAGTPRRWAAAGIAGGGVLAWLWV
jgi:mannose/fructose/N-acetylgalactosamine-specific phosphotransferase system component IIC